jgi:hypothetical protein
MIAAQAKTLLKRLEKGCSFEEATTIFAVRMMAGLSMHTQPSRPNTTGDARRVCDRTECFKVENDDTKFRKCARCRKVAYCCKECQVMHWSEHKSVCCSEPK